ncbi:hypothetical protein LIER_05868 [Lithospermum erythrorhizon]|uniref:Uncharacterized protein n=1 Tax=Lithospermum erythrorhizon TaxID=34254 RepID=A0AAV3P2P4_LITER
MPPSHVIGETPFAFVYGTEAVLLVERRLYSKWFSTNIRSYNRRLKNRQFRVGDLVLRMFAIAYLNCKNKLRPKCERPYKVTKVVRPATYELSHVNRKPINHTWHSTKLCKYYI